MKGLKSVALVLILLFVLAPFAVSQDRPSQYLQLISFTVRPGAAPQFEDFVKKVVDAANKVGVAQTWRGGQVELGGPSNTYIFALPFEKWGDRDGWSMFPAYLNEAYGDKEAANIIRVGNAAISSVDSEVHVLLAELTTGLEGAVEPSQFVFVRRSEVRREMEPEYRLFLAKVKEAQEQASDGRRSIRRVSVVGQSNIYTSATPFNNWSERDTGTSFMELMGKAHGEEEAVQLLDSVMRSVRRSETFVWRYRPDLSRPTAGAATTD
jgi:hypothetical protein